MTPTYEIDNPRLSYQTKLDLWETGFGLQIVGDNDEWLLHSILSILVPLHLLSDNALQDKTLTHSPHTTTPILKRGNNF